MTDENIEYLKIGFSVDSFETFETMVNLALRGYVAEITTEDGEKFDAELIESDFDEDESNLVVRKWNEDKAEGEGDPFKVTARSIYIY